MMNIKIIKLWIIKNNNSNNSKNTNKNLKNTNKNKTINNDISIHNYNNNKIKKILILWINKKYK